MGPQAVKVASFHVRATLAQSVAWKRAAEAYGHASVGTWLAEAADAHLDGLRRAGRPIPLAWHRGTFRVILAGGETVTVKGQVSPPFGFFAGTPEGPAIYEGRRRFSWSTCRRIEFSPRSRRLLTAARWRRTLPAPGRARGGNEPSEDPAPLLQRFQREDV